MFEQLVARRDNVKEYVKCYSVDEMETVLSYENELKAIGGRGNKRAYYQEPGFFDVETSHNHDLDNPKGWIYQWAFYYGGVCVVGRKPSEIGVLFRTLYEKLELTDKRRFIIFIHNASYEFQYLKFYLEDWFGDCNLLSIATHKIISAIYGGLEFRCSYRLSNMSLQGWCNKYKTTHIKAVGEIDYNVIRYQDSELNQSDWFYMVSDVVCMRDCLHYEMQGFTINNLPLTSTGFVRHEMRQAFRQNESENRKAFKKTALSPSTYIACKEVFAGGYTHANRFKAGQIVRGDIGHYDFRSFYPSVTRCQKFPVSKFILAENENTIQGRSLIDLVNDYKEFCCLFKIRFINVRLKKGITAPVLQWDKVLKQNIGEPMQKILDNGRVLSIKGVFTFRFTELDLELFLTQYEYDRADVLNIYTAEKGFLPDWFIETTDKFFENKANLKDSDPVLYAKSKAYLNAIYGMSASDIVRDEIILESDGEWSVLSHHNNLNDVNECIEKYYNGFNNFMRYQWGIYVTSWCRYILHNLIKNVGYEHFLYADTDSIFFVKTTENIKYIEEWNDRNLEERVKNNQYILKDNKIYEYMAFEDEHDNIREFKALHSKCYGFVNSEGELHLTIAGVPSNNGKLGADRVTREEEMQTLENLREGFIFKECGGTRMIYTEEKPHLETVNNHTLELSSAGIIVNKEYEVNDMRCDWWEYAYN